MRTFLAAAALVLPLLGGLALAQERPSSDLPKGVAADSLGKFKVTYYWVTCEDDTKGERDTELLDKKGHSLGKFRAEFVKKLRMEGTGRTVEGRTINWVGEGRCELVKTPWGLGAKDQSLEPFRSIAVDPKVIPLGTKILIPQAVGARLPDGSLHDGVFVAADTGSAIKGQHIDLFCGLERDMKIIQKRGVDEVPIFKVTRDDRKAPAGVAFPRAAVVRFAQISVRRSPDVDADAVATLARDDAVKVVGREGAFWKLGEGRWVEAPALDLRAGADAK